MTTLFRTLLDQKRGNQKPAKDKEEADTKGGIAKDFCDPNGNTGGMKVVIEAMSRKDQKDGDGSDAVETTNSIIGHDSELER